MMIPRNVIELLAPAKNAECGRAAIDHGADAIYIGAPMFGARHAAGNSVDDIAALTAYAHTYGARVHVTLNTLLFDNEVARARALAWELYRAGVDVLIVQDMALLTGDMPPIELHASTQCDNRTAEKVLFWQKMGLRQAVLARELSLTQMAQIAGQTKIRLEAFVHGALCVSYSGQCFMSLCDGGRSANRGECAQPCRLRYTLTGADGREISAGQAKHLLSLRDNNQTQNLEAMMDAGISSFKIEGRLKDADYVANITLHYRQAIDEVLARRPEFRHLSAGHVNPTFVPDPAKSFNRGFTTYFANGQRNEVWQPATSKSIGEKLGPIGQVTPVGFVIKTDKEIHNGDGLCMMHKDGRTSGLKADKTQKDRDGWRVVTNATKGLTTGTMVFRNSNVAFDAEMKRDKTTRTIGATLRLQHDGDVFALSIRDEEGLETITTRDIATEAAQNIAASRAQMERTLGKLGGTPLHAEQIEVDDSAAAHFVPAAEMNALRREAVEAHTAERRRHHAPKDCIRTEEAGTTFVKTELMRDANVTNNDARAFYEAHGATLKEWGYERQSDNKGQRVMTTRHCILRSLGRCLREHPEQKGILPMTLKSEMGREFRVMCNCKECVMEIFLSTKY